MVSTALDAFEGQAEMSRHITDRERAKTSAAQAAAHAEKRPADTMASSKRKEKRRRSSQAGRHTARDQAWAGRQQARR